jgi:hypothetical protein
VTTHASHSRPRGGKKVHSLPEKEVHVDKESAWYLTLKISQSALQTAFALGFAAVHVRRVKMQRVRSCRQNAV